MRVLFIHQNFPGQFVHLAPALRERGHEVIAFAPGTNKRPSAIPVYHYMRPSKEFPVREYGLGTDFAEKAYRGETVAYAARKFRNDRDYHPDVIFGHVGWGEMLYLAEVWPQARRLGYAEFYYRPHNSDVDFDPEFGAAELPAAMWVRSRQAAQLLSLHDIDAALSPTVFQAQSFPAFLRERIEVIHEGIDTERLRPDPRATLRLPGVDRTFRAGDELLTFVNRNLEPYRGYHILMRALPRILRERPQAHVVLVGADAKGYGPVPREGGTWKQIFLDEVASKLDMARVHFTGQIDTPNFARLMQVSRAHAYLTYPFVLSWSMLEAMSAGALVVGSRTAPVEEVIRHGENGLLVDFFDVDGWADTIISALAEPERYAGIRRAARQKILDTYDLRRICLPRLVEFVERHGKPR